jgi:hypothetical protein
VKRNVDFPHTERVWELSREHGHWQHIQLENDFLRTRRVDCGSVR